MSETGIQADWRLRLGCAITHSNIDLVLQCSDRGEYYRIIRHASNLVFVFVVTLVLWSVSLYGMLPAWGAVGFALIPAVGVYLLDLCFLVSDLGSKGVLAEQQSFSHRFLHFWWWLLTVVLIRLVISLIFATATGTLVMLKLADSQIEERLHAKQIAHNTPIMTEFEAAADRAKQELFTSLQQERNIELKARDVALERSRQSGLNLSQIEQEVSLARLEMMREDTGLNRKGGKGPRYQDAKIRMEEALRHAELSRQEIGQQKAEIASIESRIDAIDTRWREAETAYSSRKAVLTADRDSKLMPERDGLFLKHTTLEELKNDDEYGLSIKLSSWLAKAVIMALELTFFVGLMKDIGSAYVTRARKTVEYEDRRANKEYDNAMDELEASATQANHSSEQNTVGNQSISGVDHTAPLFDPADAESSGEECRDDLASASPSSRADDERYSIIGGAPDERITLAEALADRERYWVNQDRPEEIWLREYYAAIHGTADNRAA
ncbi:MAG: DUF4407 domain-containing protein [Nitrosomonas sp.]